MFFLLMFLLLVFFLLFLILLLLMFLPFLVAGTAICRFHVRRRQSSHPDASASYWRASGVQAHAILLIPTLLQLLLRRRLHHRLPILFRQRAGMQPESRQLRHGQFLDFFAGNGRFFDDAFSR